MGVDGFREEPGWVSNVGSDEPGSGGSVVRDELGWGASLARALMVLRIS